MKAIIATILLIGSYLCGVAAGIVLIIKGFTILGFLSLIGSFSCALLVYLLVEERDKLNEQIAQQIKIHIATNISTTIVGVNTEEEALIANSQKKIIFVPKDKLEVSESGLSLSIKD